MIFRLDFKIYTKIKIKSTIKYQEENFKEISVACSFRRFSSAAEGKAKSRDNLLKKSRKKSFLLCLVNSSNSRYLHETVWVETTTSSKKMNTENFEKLGNSLSSVHYLLVKSSKKGVFIANRKPSYYKRY
jgi:hypothetical protein